MHHHTPLACRGTCIFVSKWAQRLRQAAGGCIITTPPPPQHFLSPIWCVPTPVTVRAPTLCVRLSMPPRRPSHEARAHPAVVDRLRRSGMEGWRQMSHAQKSSVQRCYLCSAALHRQPALSLSPSPPLAFVRQLHAAKRRLRAECNMLLLHTAVSGQGFYSTKLDIISHFLCTKICNRCILVCLKRTQPKRRDKKSIPRA